MCIAQEKTTTRQLKFLFLNRSRLRLEGTATGRAVSSAYDHNSLYFIFGETRDGKTCMPHVDLLRFSEITNPKTGPRPGLCL